LKGETNLYAKELEILKKAILNEHEGNQFYRLAAEKASDEQVRQAFLALAAEEQEHEQWLKNLYQELMRNKPPEAEKFSLPPVASPGIFSRENIGTESGSLIVSVFSIGVMMEKASLDFYREAARKTGLDAAKRLYLRLAEWEQEHLTKLESAYDYAREEWWDKQSFSPA
jgi:rubrerythrin